MGVSTVERKSGGVSATLFAQEVQVSLVREQIESIDLTALSEPDQRKVRFMMLEHEPVFATCNRPWLYQPGDA